MISVGLDIGQRRDPTAVAVFDAALQTSLTLPSIETKVDGITTLVQDRTPIASKWMTYDCRLIEPLPLDTPYDIVARHIAVLMTRLYLRSKESPWLFVDATGHWSFIDILRVELARIPHRLIPVTLGAGDRCAKNLRNGYEEWTIGKRWLVSRINGLLQLRRLRLKEGDPRVKLLLSELQDFEVRARREDEGRHEESGAKAGAHDDLVIAAGLGTLIDASSSIAGVLDPDEYSRVGGRWNAWM